MKVLLYFEGEKALRQSGIGRALRHQKMALRSNDVDFTLDMNDTYDIIHTNTVFNKSYRLMRKAQRQGKKVIVHGHSTKEDFRHSFRFWQLEAPFFNHMLLKMYRHADAIITPTPYSKDLIENYKGVECPVYDASNGINLEEYAYEEVRVQKYKEFFNITNEKVVIGVGLFFDRKGIRDFFEVARRMPNVKFIWFGNLNKALVTHKVNKAIKKRPSNVIMPGYIDGDVIKGAFLAADALLFPSYEETEGIVVLEGLASRIPVIVRDIGVYKPWLEHKKQVLMGKSNDEFVELINYVFMHDMTKMLDEGYKVVEERSIKNVGKKLKEVYEKIAK